MNTLSCSIDLKLKIISEYGTRGSSERILITYMDNPNYIFVLIVVFASGFCFGSIYRLILNKLDEKKRLANQGSILKGNIGQQLAPYLQNWPENLNPADAKFLGSPVDFIVFNGIKDGNINEVVFVEVKTGNSHLNKNEFSLKKAIDEKKVRYIPYNIPSEILKTE